MSPSDRLELGGGWIGPPFPTHWVGTRDQAKQAWPSLRSADWLFVWGRREAAAGGEQIP